MTELTEREQEILNLISEGYSCKEIAVRLGCAENTIKIHRLHILQKTEAGNITHAFKIVIEYNTKTVLK